MHRRHWRWDASVSSSRSVISVPDARKDRGGGAASAGRVNSVVRRRSRAVAAAVRAAMWTAAKVTCGNEYPSGARR